MAAARRAREAGDEAGARRIIYGAEVQAPPARAVVRDLDEWEAEEAQAERDADWAQMEAGYDNYNYREDDYHCDYDDLC